MKVVPMSKSVFVWLTVLSLSAVSILAAEPPAQLVQVDQVGPVTIQIDPQKYPHMLHVSKTEGSDADGDGSREKAFATLDKALSAATGAGEKNRFAILVAAGHYGRSTLVMTPYVDFYGGFEPATWQRDIAKHKTVLDGKAERRVVVGADNALIDGFIIRSGSVAGSGAGILCDHTSPTISNNVFQDNLAIQRAQAVAGEYHQLGHEGGAIAVLNAASPWIVGNLIVGNRTENGGGGGIAVRNRSFPVIERNVIAGNRTGLKDNDPERDKRSRSSSGGAIACNDSPPGVKDGQRALRITGNLILNNYAGGNSDAGGIYCENDAAADVSGNYILGNVAEDDGGGMYIMKSSEPLVAANYFAGNGKGNAIRLSKEGRARLTGNFIDGSLVCVDSWMEATNNTVSSLHYMNNRYPHLKPSIVVNNIFTGPAATVLRMETKEPLQFRNCAVPVKVPGEGNIDAPAQIDAQTVDVPLKGLKFDPRTYQTTMQIDSTPETAKWVGRAIHVGDKWGVVRAASATQAVVWGDLGTPADGASVSARLAPTGRLEKGSPCIDQGSSENAPAHDLHGRPRIGGVDIGAIEFSSETTSLR